MANLRRRSFSSGLRAEVIHVVISPGSCDRVIDHLSHLARVLFGAHDMLMRLEVPAQTVVDSSDSMVSSCYSGPWVRTWSPAEFSFLCLIIHHILCSRDFLIVPVRLRMFGAVVS